MPENKKSIYIRIKGLAIGENGQPDDAYARLELPGEIAAQLPDDYGELAKKTSANQIMSAFGLDATARDHECVIITPEEYRAAMDED